MLWGSLVVDNIGACVTVDGSGAHGLGVVHDAVVVVDADRIAFVGPKHSAPPDVARAGVPVVDAGGGLVVPGLIDCHTHVLFAGDRADEFARRARGESYAQIMAAGGGIRSTMRAVRAASVDDLVAAAAPRLSRMLARGVTTIEAKSGYGLDVDNELKMLRALRALHAAQPITVVPTLLAAHAVPPEFEGRAGAWCDTITRELIPAVADEGLATAVDVFVEAGAFSVDDARPMLRAAQERGLHVRVHAEQLSRQGGAQLAAELGARSAGHLEFVDVDDARALADAGVVCEILSLAQVFLRGQRAIPGRMLKDAGCRVAIGTDMNPGTAMSSDLLLAAGLAVTQSALTVEEAVCGITADAAHAVGLDDRGVLAVGKRADLAVFRDAHHYADLVYRWSDLSADVVVAGGRVVRA
jgi:imidazolonepropionase